MPNESTKWLYEQLTKRGYNVGKDQTEFDSLMATNAESRTWAFETARKSGLNVGKDMDEFTSLVAPAPSPQTPPAAPAPTQAAQTQAPAVQSTATAAPTSTPAPAPTKEPEQAPVQSAPQQPAWQPTEQDKIRMSYQMHTMLNDFNQKSKARLEQIQRLSEPFTPEGRKKRRELEFQARLAGTPTKVMGLTPPTSASASDGAQGEVEGAAQPQPVQSGQSPVPYGVKYIDGKPVTQWLLPDGRLTTNLMEADQAEYVARTNRLARRANASMDARIKQAEAELAELEKQYQESSSRVHEEWAEDYKKNKAPLAAVLAANTYVPRQQSDKENSALRVAIRQKEEQIKDLKEERDRQAGKDVGFWRGFGRTVSDVRTWDFGMGDLSDAMTMLNAEHYSSPNATEGERKAGEAMMKAIYDKQETENLYSGNTSWWNRAGGMTGHMPAFMLDFAFTGGGYGSVVKVGAKAATKQTVKMFGKKAIEEMAELGVKGYAKKYGVRGVGRMAGNWTVKALGTTTDDLLVRAPLMTNTVQGGKTAADIIDRKLGDVVVDENGNYDFSNDKTWGSAVWQGEANSIIENYSEMFGTHIDGIAPMLAKTFGGKRISGMLARANASGLGQVLDTTRKQFQHLGVSDYFGEVGEEYYGQLWRTMLNLDDAYTNVPVFDAQGNPMIDEHGNPITERKNLLFTGQFHGDIWGGMALSMGLMGAGKYTLTGAGYLNMKREVNKADRTASQILGHDEWESLRGTIDNTTNEDMGALAENIISDSSLSEDERAAVMEYMERNLNLRGLNLATLAQNRGAETEAPIALEDVYEYPPLSVEGEEEPSSFTPEQAEAHRLYSEGRELFGRFEEGDPTVQADVDAIALRMQEAYQAVEDAFGAEAEYYMFHVNENPWALVNDPELTIEQQDAVLYYINAKAALDGVMDASNEAADRKRAEVEESVAKRTHKDKDGKDDGTIISAETKMGKHVYIVMGDVVMFPDGKGVDRQNSSSQIWVLNPESGEYESSAPEFIEKILGIVNPQDELDTALSVIEQEQMNIFGDNAVAPEESAEGEEPQQTTEAPATADTVEYDRGYEQGLEEAAKADDAWIANHINILSQNTPESMPDTMKGELDAYLYEQQRRAQSVPETPESVPNPTENPEIDAENSENPTGSVPKLETEPQQSALSRIPLDDKGKPNFAAAPDTDTAWDALVEKTNDEAMAQSYADNMVAAKEAALKKAEKAKTKPTEDLDEFMAAEQQRKNAITAAQNELATWQRIAGTSKRRSDAIRAQQEAEARAATQARAEQEAVDKAAREEQERIEREALEGIPEWHLDTPENARKRGARRFQGQLFTRQEPLQGVAGKEIEVKFSQNDLPKGRVAVIDAAQLQPSHIQGNRNPMFFIEDAQPKNRAEQVSMIAAREIAEGIRPEEITGSATAYTGAPTVNTRGEVIQGNNRSDALRYLWENKLPEQQGKYRQYIIDNAAQFGLDPEAVANMEHPVLVNMLDVDDAEAVRLGMMTAQDTESGGVERIKPKNVAQKLGDGMRTFANMLLNSGDEDASFGQLVDRNGTEVLKWMAQTGAITGTQYRSAFDSKGNLTAEAKNDLQKVLYQAVFKGGSQQLEEMFDKLPAKAQRAILSTAFRDMDSPFTGRLLPELQASIIAYNELMTDPVFASAKKLEECLNAVEAYKRVLSLDDRFETVSPSDNFSNFAMHLAAMYKASDLSQSTLASYFNQMYDLAQGKKAATLFEEADTTEYPLAEVVNKVLGIDYQPAKNGNNNVANGGADVALHNQNGQGGELRGNEPPASGEQNPAGTEPSKRGTGTASDSGQGGEVATEEAITLINSIFDESGHLIDSIRLTELGLSIEQQSKLRAISAKRTKGWEFDATGRTSTIKIGGQDGFELTKDEMRELGRLNAKYNAGIISRKELSDAHTALGNRVATRIANEILDSSQGAEQHDFDDLDTSALEKRVNVSDDGWTEGEGNNPTYKRTITIDGKHKVIQVDEPDSNGFYTGSYFEFNGGRFGDLKEIADYIDGKTTCPVCGKKHIPNYKEQDVVCPQCNTDLSVFRQIDQLSDEEAVKVLANIERMQAEPTESQKAAGNYKMEHRRINGYNISIENPKGSVRRGTGADGKPWETTMQNDYGYIRGTEGVDGDHIDVFLSDTPEEGDVFVVDQVNKDGSFDEHKVMYGFPTEQAARDAYLSNYEPGWTGLGAITHVSKDEFKKWIGSSRRKTKPFAEYKSVKVYKEQNPNLAIEPDGFGDFGPVFTQFKGDAQGAIKVLSELQDGEAIGALHHKDIGDIDLVWGNAGTGKSDGFGLAKLVKFHPEVVEHLQEILDEMHIVMRSENRINLESDAHKAAVRLTWNKECI